MDNSAKMLAAKCPAVRWMLPLALLAGVTAVPGAAAACFFYEEPEDHVMVDETALQVVLQQSGGSTTMIVGTRTEGYVPDLGWILPVPQRPTVQVARAETFVALDAATAPIFRTSSGTSAYASSSGSGCGGGDSASGTGDGPEDHDQVTVWDSTVVGPYSVQVLTAGSVSDLRSWVEESGYPWRPETEPVFQQYIDARWFFVAARLLPAEDTSSLAPLAVTYEGSELVLPLLNSQADSSTVLGLLVWIVADQPARPRNWAQVAVTESQIVTGGETGSNYPSLVETAVRELGGGRAFVTEYVQRAYDTTPRILDGPTRDLVGTAAWVTRLYSRVQRAELTVDPTFELSSDIAPVAQRHDLTLVEGSPYWGGAYRPAFGLAPIGLLLGLRLLRRRRGS